MSKIITNESEIREIYSKLTRHFRQLIVDEVKNGDYECIINPNSKSERKRRSEEELCCKVNILARPIIFEKTNKRNLNTGIKETTIVINGQLNDIYDFSKGFTITYNGGLRTRASQDIRKSETMNYDFNLQLLVAGDFLHQYIQQGQYKDFTKTFLNLVNKTYINERERIKLLRIMD